MYTLKLIETPELEVETTDSGRFYTTPEGNVYPSVTTVLGSFEKEYLQNWIKRVGQKEADRIRDQAGRKGTAVHRMIERMLLGEENLFKGEMPVNIAHFKTIRKGLDGRLTDVYAMENSLWSDKLKVAGRVDCIGAYDGKPSIIDFKTSNKLKDITQIGDYFIQTTTYSMMWEEITGMKVDQLVIVMVVNDEPEPFIFIQDRSDWLMPTAKKMFDYHKKMVASSSI